MSQSAIRRLAPLMLILLLAGCGPRLPGLPNNTNLPPGVLFQDDFENPGEDWTTANDGIVIYEIQSGQLVVTINDTTGGAFSTLQYTLDNFIIEVDTLKLAGLDDNGFGVLFRYQDTENFYRFDISSDGYYAVTRSKGGVYEAISEWQANPAILLGAQSNRVRVEANGNTFRFGVNDTFPLPLCVGDGAIWDPANPDGCLGGEVVEAWTDNDFPKGQIALGVSLANEAGTSIAFDNVTISQVGE